MTSRIMAVTKGVSIDRILPILKEKSITLIGESRWQEAKHKLPEFPAHIEKHFIGHLQTNKAPEVVQHFDCVESVDSIRLATALNNEAKKQGKQLPIFLQINISNDSNKYGFMIDELEEAVKKIGVLQNLSITGLMTITAHDQTPDETREDFKTMKTLQLHYELPELSMGMSSDWEMAAEEGATIVRLGQALFGHRM